VRVYDGITVGFSVDNGVGFGVKTGVPGNVASYDLLKVLCGVDLGVKNGVRANEASYVLLEDI